MYCYASFIDRLFMAGVRDKREYEPAIFFLPFLIRFVVLRHVRGPYGSVLASILSGFSFLAALRRNLPRLNCW
ncbi:hypothetical protein GGS21DRAFT_172193 [Xylaria nigripes]|nr:hypothetical protein GGS21DRAFT_172193 [Xylaria nigripes]